MRSMFAAVVLAGVFVFGGCAGSQHAGGDAGGEGAASLTSEAPIEASSVVLEVHGLSCPLCATNLDKKLEGVSGVNMVSVNLEDGLVQVGFDDASPRPSPRMLAKAVTDSGFTLVRITPN